MAADKPRWTGPPRRRLNGQCKFQRRACAISACCAAVHKLLPLVNAGQVMVIERVAVLRGRAPAPQHGPGLNNWL